MKIRTASARKFIDDARKQPCVATPCHEKCLAEDAADMCEAIERVDALPPLHPPKDAYEVGFNDGLMQARKALGL